LQSGSVSVQVNTKPTITSGWSTTFSTGTVQSYTLRATGSPTPYWILTSGTLPAGITFSGKADGTATISGKVGKGLAGLSLSLVFTARSLGGASDRPFTLKFK
jgi:hypothetical protein